MIQENSYFTKHHNLKIHIADTPLQKILNVYLLFPLLANYPDIVRHR